jgi:hypothetical protein
MFTWFGKWNDSPMNRLVAIFSVSAIAAKVTLFGIAPVFFGVLAVLYASFPTGACGAESVPATPSGKKHSTSIIWAELLQKTPFPHTAPLPAKVQTALDGTYAKFDPKKTPPVACRRCPDYVPQGGIWKLNLDKGIFRIFHESTGWRSIGSFVIDQNRMQVFNDPCCIEVKGFYRWTLGQGDLKLQVVEDKCAIGQRAKNLIQIPWQSCQPPSMEAGFSGHWEKPTGCE